MAAFSSFLDILPDPSNPIGEAGQSEAVIPLNRLPQMIGSLGGNQKGEFTLRGQDLILALERAGDFRARITG